jgi:branched-chain amino acid transport system permease protein
MNMKTTRIRLNFSYKGALLIVPFLLIPLLGNLYLTRTFINIIIFAVLALSWDFIAGYYRLGIISFAHAGLFALGGYVSGMLAIYWGLSPFVGFVAAGLAAAAFSLLLSLVALRFPGRFNLYYIVVSVGMADVLRLVWVNEYHVTGGTTGLVLPPLFDVTNLQLSYYLNYYFSLLILMALVGTIIYINRRPLGYAIRAIYEDEVTAATIGVNVNRTKVLGIVIGGAFAGLAGSAFCHISQAVGPDLGSRYYMLLIFFMAYAGGSGSIVGPVLGSVLWTGIYEGLRAMRPLLVGFDWFRPIEPFFQTFILTLVFLLILRFVGWRGLWGSVGPRIKKALKSE